MAILVTGGAGFIGSALIEKLLSNNEEIINLDNLNSYYDSSLKLARLNNINKLVKKYNSKYKFYKVSLENKLAINNIFQSHSFSTVVHLAAQAGVRYSIDNPESYFQSNLLGFGNILEAVREKEVKNFVFASSSSVYGDNKKIPFQEDHQVDKPLSLYAATKKSNELMAHAYSHLYGIPTTGLRFFTVYGPWGRPDMAPFIFTKSILERSKIKIFNKGNMRRDFTYIDDIVEGVFKCCYKPALPDKNLSKLHNSAPFKIFNIGNGNPIQLMRFIEILEKELGILSEKDFLEMQMGDVVETWASTDALKKWVDYYPKTPIEYGLKKFVEWYKEFYNIRD